MAQDYRVIEPTSWPINLVIGSPIVGYALMDLSCWRDSHPLEDSQLRCTLFVVTFLTGNLRVNVHDFEDKLATAMP
jgi:hypothetical protein